MNNPDYAKSALHKFLLIHRHLRKDRHRHKHDEQPSPRHISVLRFLKAEGPATIGDVQEHLYTSPSTASSIISHLEDGGYVERTRSKDDNRVVFVTITDQGKTLAETAPISGIGLLRAGLKTLPPDRLQNIDEALADIMTLMEVTETE